MSVDFYRGSPGKFDSRTLNRTTLNRWTGRSASGALVRVSACYVIYVICNMCYTYIYIYIHICMLCYGILQGRAVRDMQRGPDHPEGKTISR